MSELTAEILRPLATACESADGVAAFGEQTWLDIAAGEGAGYLFWDADGSVLRGACHVGADGTWAELAVHPEHRRRGTGRAMAELLRRERGGVRVWAHGDLPGAVGLAEAVGSQRVRTLLHMTLPGEALEAVTAPRLPEGFAVRTFTGADVAAWLAVNARAFAYHPEQGRVDADDLRARTQEDWFSAGDFFLLEDVTVQPPALAGYHWTKYVAAQREGEVYVVGIDPGYQGRGLGGPLTALGLAHLRRRGASSVGLYVEGDNHAALRTYERLGFTTDARDVMYAVPDLDRGGHGEECSHERADHP